MAIPDSIQVEFTAAIPLKLRRDKDGVSVPVTSTASVPVLLVAEGGDIISVFNEGPADLWFKICSSTSATRATYGSEPIVAGNKEVFELPSLPNREDRNYISFISRNPTKATYNTYPRGT